MSKLVKKYIHHLHVLNNSEKACNRQEFIKQQPVDFTKCLCEICDNLLKGNIPLTPKDKKRLERYRKQIRFLAEHKGKNIKAKRVRILQKGGAAFLPILLPSLLTIAAELLRK